MNQSLFAKKSSAYIALTRLNRPIGIYLLMWPMLWAFWFAAGGFPDPALLLIFLAGTVLTRSAGCAINDFADRDFDKHVARTKNRPITAGLVSGREALLLALVLMLMAFALVLLTDKQTILLSFVGVALAVLYPYTKRFTYMPQVFLGAAFSWAIPMAYSAQTGELTRITWLIYMASLLWAVAYDTLYAMADREDDLKIGVKSSAILFGAADIVIIGIIQSMVLLTLVLVGLSEERGIFFFSGLLIAAGLAIYQLWIVRTREPARCIEAFLNNSTLGMIIFIGIVLDFALVGDV